MLYAKPKIDLRKIEEIGELIVVWLPMKKIKYRAGWRSKEMCFDAFTPVKIGTPEAYVWFMRNPKHVRIVRGEITVGRPLPSLIDGPRILDILIRLKAIATSFVAKTEETMSGILKKHILQLVVPAQIVGSKKLRSIEQYVPIFELLDSIGIGVDSKYISDETVMWPLVIDTKERIAYEPALQVEPSKSYTEAIRKHGLIEAIGEYLGGV